MTKITFKILELKPYEYEFIKNYATNYLIGLYLLFGISCWRAQIAASQNTNTISKKELQGTSSMVYTAKLIAKNENISEIIATISVSDTSLAQQDEYAKLEPEKRSDFVRSQISEVQTSGPAKLYNPRQIDNNTLTSHRRGIVAKLRGTIQALTLYKPGDLITGVNILLLDWDNFNKAYLNFLDYIKVDQKEAIEQFKEQSIIALPRVKTLPLVMKNMKLKI